MTKLNYNLKGLFIGLLVISVLEILLRSLFGFCDAVLVQEDDDFEYIAQPNQHRSRFMNTIIYNRYSMRSEELEYDTAKILGFGDSVFNGGVLTDQELLASEMLTQELIVNGEKVQFLNISSRSWGPDNCFAYLKRYGNFDAFKIYLFVNSHDAYDHMTFNPIIGLDKSFPNKQYTFAMIELIDRYILPRLFQRLKISNGTPEDNRREQGQINPGFRSFMEYSNKHDIPLVLYLHADKTELNSGDYNGSGQQIIEFANNNNIPLIQDLNNGLKEEHFRDLIHLNENGQRLMADLIINYEMAQNY